MGSTARVGAGVEERASRSSLERVSSLPRLRPRLACEMVFREACRLAWKRGPPDRLSGEWLRDLIRLFRLPLRRARRIVWNARIRACGPPPRPDPKIRLEMLLGFARRARASARDPPD